MKRLITCAAIAVLGVGCAGTALDSAGGTSPGFAVRKTDLAVAGWRVPFECLGLSEQIEASEARLYDATSGTFSTSRGTDQRRLRSLESRADEFGCLVPGSPYTY